MMPGTAGPAVALAASRIGVDPSWLAGLIEFESGGRWDPAIRNPYSSARGLLQWLDATARGLGYASSLDLVSRNPTIDAQLRGPVVAYLAPLGPFPSLQSLAMAVFYPAFRTAPADTVFPSNVRAANPGIRTVADYVSKVAAKIVPWPGGAAPSPAPIVPSWALLIGALLAAAVLVSVLR